MFVSSLKLVFECTLDGCSWPNADVCISPAGPHLAKATLPHNGLPITRAERAVLSERGVGFIGVLDSADCPARYLYDFIRRSYPSKDVQRF
jgi:hypothetical protein